MPTSKLVASLAIFLILMSLFLVVYRGQPVSGDELALFSATESLSKYQSLNLYSVYHFYRTLDVEQPWIVLLHEPLHSVVAIPLYVLAWGLGLGMMHAVWFLNPLITAGIGVLLYHLGRQLNYSHRTSFVTAFIVPSTTMLLPYTQTFFREPLVGLFGLLAIWLALRYRQAQRLVWLIGMIGVIFLAVLTKEVSYTLVLPVLMVAIFPQGVYPTRRQLVTMVVVVGVIAVGNVFFSWLFSNGWRFESVSYTELVSNTDIDDVLNVVGAYTVSPGRSLWATSPILLLAFYGAWLVRRQWALAVAPFLYLFVVSFVYAVGSLDWHGARGWLSRYLVVVVPVMGILLLPVIDRLWQAKDYTLKIVFGVLVAWSIVIQLGGVLVPLDIFYDTLGARYPGQAPVVFFEEGTWNLTDTQWWIATQNLKLHNEYLGWQFAKPPVLWLGLCSLLLMAAVLMLKYPDKRYLRWGGVALLPIVFMALLSLLQDDPRYLQDRPALYQLLAELENRVQDNDFIVLSDPEYESFFQNNYRGQVPYTVLPYSTTDRYTPDGPEPILIDYDENGIIEPSEYIDSSASRLGLWLTADASRNLWFVTDRGVFDTWSYRGVETFLGALAYPVQDIPIAEDDVIRLMWFYADGNYHSPYIEPVDHTFGASIQVTDVGVPDRVSTGSILPIALRWIVDDTVATDYHVNVSLLDANGIPVAQRSGTPNGTTGNFVRWAAYPQFWDRYGLVIAEGLPSGEYTLVISLYDWQTGEILLVDGEQEALVLGVIAVVNE